MRKFNESPCGSFWQQPRRNSIPTYCWFLLVAGCSVIGDFASAQSDRKAELSACVHLQRIGGTYAKVEDKVYSVAIFGKKLSAKDLEKVCVLKEIRILTLGYVTLTEDGVSHLKKLTKLQQLNLALASISDASLQHIGSLENLEHLYLNGTKVTDEGMKHLAGLKKLTQLAIQETKVTATGMKHFSKPTKLKRLDLSKGQVSESCISQLQNMKALKSLCIHGPKVTDADINAIKKLLPKIRVFRSRPTNSTRF